MKDNELPILEIKDVEWDKDHDEFVKLPKEFQLKWPTRDWNIDDVSNWISKKYDWIFSSINISQIGVWEDSGCCCAGGCSCC